MCSESHAGDKTSPDPTVRTVQRQTQTHTGSRMSYVHWRGCFEAADDEKCLM